MKEKKSNCLSNRIRLWYCTNRSIEGEQLFETVSDRIDFLERLEWLCGCNMIDIFGISLYHNSYHLLLNEGPGTPPVRIASQLAIGYARGYNLRHGRRGQLFRREKQVSAIDSPKQLLSLVEDYFRIKNGQRLLLYSNGGHITQKIREYLEKHSQGTE